MCFSKLCKTTKKFIKAPTKGFNDVSKTGLGDTFKYYIPLLLFYSVLIIVVNAILLMLPAETIASMGAIGLGIAVLSAAASQMGIAIILLIIFVASFVSSIVLVMIGGLWLHLFVYMFGGRRGLVQTYKSLMYGATPHLLFGWIPFVSAVTSIWYLVLGIFGVRGLHKMGTGRAIAAVIVPLVVFFGIYYSIVFSGLLYFGGEVVV